MLYFDLHTYSGILASEDSIRIIKVRHGEDEAVFDNSDEKVILQQFSQYVHEKDPDIIVSLGDYDNGKKLRYLSDRGVDLQLAKICISSSYRKTTYFDQFGFAGLIERARFGFLPLELAAKYSINRLIDSRNCFELIQKDFVIPSRSGGINHEHIRTVEQIVAGDKGGMVISPQIVLHEDVLALDYDNEYANLIVNHNLSYETVPGEAEKGLLPTVIERFLKRRLYFKKVLKELPKDSQEYVWYEQRVDSLKNILVCLYGSTSSLWNRFGNVLVFEEINRLSRDVLIKTKDIVQGLGYTLVYADTDSVFIKRKSSATDYNELIHTLSRETGLSISVDYHYKFLVLLPLEADDNIEVLKHYFGITFDNDLVVRGIEIRRHDVPAFIKRFQTQLIYTLFDCKNSSEVLTKGYEDALLLVLKQSIP